MTIDEALDAADAQTRLGQQADKEGRHKDATDHYKHAQWLTDKALSG